MRFPSSTAPRPRAADKIPSSPGTTRRSAAAMATPKAPARSACRAPCATPATPTPCSCPPAASTASATGAAAPAKPPPATGPARCRHRAPATPGRAPAKCHPPSRSLRPATRFRGCHAAAEHGLRALAPARVAAIPRDARAGRAALRNVARKLIARDGRRLIALRPVSQVRIALVRHFRPFPSVCAPTLECRAKPLGSPPVRQPPTCPAGDLRAISAHFQHRVPDRPVLLDQQRPPTRRVSLDPLRRLGFERVQRLANRPRRLRERTRRLDDGLPQLDVALAHQHVAMLDRMVLHQLPEQLHLSFKFWQTAVSTRTTSAMLPNSAACSPAIASRARCITRFASSEPSSRSRNASTSIS